MERKTIKRELFEIAKTRPTLMGTLMKELPGGGTVGAQWTEVIFGHKLDPDHFANVCDEYATCKKSIPEPQDRLLEAIIEEVKDRAYRDHDRWEQHEKHHRPRKGEVMKLVKGTEYGRIAVRLGEMVRDGIITPEENAKRMDEAEAWDKGGPQPDWLMNFWGKPRHEPSPEEIKEQTKAIQETWDDKTRKTREVVSPQRPEIQTIEDPCHYYGRSNVEASGE